jgi:YihY family inner membrane protein
MNDEESTKQETPPPSLDGGPPIGRAREAGTWAQCKALALYMTKTEVHTYAFSVAANVILSLAPFIVLMLTVTRQVFHSDTMWGVVRDMMVHFLPSNQAYVMRNLEWLARPHKSAQLFSLAMLLFTSTGVFLPLEVALNEVWEVKKNRSYLHNQAVSAGLAAGVGLLVMLSVAITAAQQAVLSWIFFGHTENFVFNALAGGFLKIVALLASVGVFFLIYWLLPHRKIPIRAVWPTAVVVGVLWEVAKYLYILALPHLDFPAVYGPFSVSVGLMMWSFLSGLLLLAGAYVSATRHALRMARASERK